MKHTLLFLLALVTCSAFASNTDNPVTPVTNNSEITSPLMRIATVMGPVKQEWKGILPDAPVSYVPNNGPNPNTHGSFNYGSTKESGYMGFVDIGGLFGVGEHITIHGYGGYSASLKTTYHEDFFSMRIVNGRLINRHVYLGFGMGFDVAPYNTAKFTYPLDLNIIGTSNNAPSYDFLLPLYMDVRGYFMEGRFSPYIEAKFGGAFYLPGPTTALNGYLFTGGGQVGLSIGARAFITNRVAAHFSIGYLMQNLEEQYQYVIPGVNYSTQTEVCPAFLHFISVSASISF